MNTTTKTTATKTLRLTSRAKSPKVAKTPKPTKAAKSAKSTKPVEAKLQQAIEQRAADLVEAAEAQPDPVLELLIGGATRDELVSATGLSLAQVRARIGHIRNKLGFKIVLRAVKEQGA